METLLYTVVGLAIISVVLSFAIPKLEQNKERALIVEQISTLKSLDVIILELANAPVGSAKTYHLSLNRGSLTIDGVGNTIATSLDTSAQYSEPGAAVQDGRVSVLTTQIGKKSYRVTLSMSYNPSGINLTANHADTMLEFTQAPTPYLLQVRREQGVHVDAQSGKTILRPYITIAEQRRAAG